MPWSCRPSITSILGVDIDCNMKVYIMGRFNYGTMMWLGSRCLFHPTPSKVHMPESRTKRHSIVDARALTKKKPYLLNLSAHRASPLCFLDDIVSNEVVVFHHSEETGHRLDFESLSTPAWTVDKRSYSKTAPDTLLNLSQVGWPNGIN